MTSELLTDRRNCGMRVQGVAAMGSERKHWGQQQTHITQLAVSIECEREGCDLNEKLVIPANFVLSSDESVDNLIRDQIKYPYSSVNVRAKQFRVKACPLYEECRNQDRLA